MRQRAGHEAADTSRQVLYYIGENGRPARDSPRISAMTGASKRDTAREMDAACAGCSLCGVGRQVG
jgi:hypothetical protein